MRSVLKLGLVVPCTLLVSLFALTGSAQELSPISKNCFDSRIDGSVLTSTCYRDFGVQGKSNTTTIDLKPFLENVDGTLKWQPGNFSETCGKIQFTGLSTLYAECGRRNGEYIGTWINLDDHIASTIDGILTYK